MKGTHMVRMTRMVGRVYFSLLTCGIDEMITSFVGSYLVAEPSAESFRGNDELPVFWHHVRTNSSNGRGG